MSEYTLVVKFTAPPTPYLGLSIPLFKGWSSYVHTIVLRFQKLDSTLGFQSIYGSHWRLTVPEGAPCFTRLVGEDYRQVGLGKDSQCRRSLRGRQPSLST